ncbi:MAG: MBL fold metallo-hydrolase [Kiritimatiellae bacterium]|nr:MBL fold metallo-hydrolase [Kiritimatiellia bacterium]
MRNPSRRSFVKTLSLQTGALLAGTSRAPPPNPVDPPELLSTTRHGDLKIHTLRLGELSVNCYVVSEGNRNCIVIDPGAQADVILAFLKERSFKVKAYVLTHSHLDHISALDECFKALPAPVAMHPEEDDWAFCDKNQWLPHYPKTERVPVERPLAHGQKFSDNALNYIVLHTPGHSPGSVCLWFPEKKIIFSGDTLFAGAVGRTDLHRSSHSALLKSLRIFLRLPPETVVYPGHGATTTLRTEIATNPFF